MTTYTKILKPTGTSYTNQNSLGKQQYDEPLLAYDDASTFYDSLNTGQYTKVAKPAGTVYTKLTKPT